MCYTCVCVFCMFCYALVFLFTDVLDLCIVLLIVVYVVMFGAGRSTPAAAGQDESIHTGRYERDPDPDTISFTTSTTHVKHTVPSSFSFL